MINVRVHLLKEIKKTAHLNALTIDQPLLASPEPEATTP